MSERALVDATSPSVRRVGHVSPSPDSLQHASTPHRNRTTQSAVDPRRPHDGESEAHVRTSSLFAGAQREDVELMAMEIVTIAPQSEGA